MPAQGLLAYECGAWEINLARRELRLHGKSVPLGPRAFEVVEVLIQSAGELVSREDLMSRVWPTVTVGDNTLDVHLSAIRKALGADRWMLQTTTGRGYRLLGDWAVRRHDTAQPPVGLQRVQVDGEPLVTNFPASVIRLVGRTAAVARLRDLLSAYRAVTLTGPGGIGKTTLALEVSRRFGGEFPEGGWLVELASLSDPTLVPTTLADVLRIGLRSDAVSAEAVARAIGKKKLLLVFDNCEHLVEAVAELAETILALCPNTTILSTSREILRIQGEYVYRVPPLDVPPADQTEAARGLQHSASELFVVRAEEAGVDLSANATDLWIIGAICRHLDGIPLAIELAAARAAALGLQAVAIGLRERFALLTTGRRTLSRHQTLRATLDWSYQLLSETEQRLLNRLAIFVGPFSLEAACAVLSASVNEAVVANRIAGLVGKSLVLKAGDPLTAEFRLLETTRAYAFDRLTESGAVAEVACRHSEYLMKVLGNVEEEVRSTPSCQHVAEFRRRATEIHAALEWAFSTIGEPAIGVALTIAAVPLWFELSQLTVARGRIEQALPHAERGSDQEMRLRIALGHSLWYLGPGSDAMGQNFTRGLEIAVRVGATAVHTRALWGLWAAHRARDDYRAALGVALRYADAAAGARDLGASHLAERIVALSHHLLGHQQLAQEWTERALSRPQALDPSSGMGYQVETPVAMPALLARILWIRGFPDQATAAAAEAVSAAEMSGHSFAMAYAVTFAGLPVALWTGALEEGRRQLDVLATHAAGNQRMEDWRLCYGRALKLRHGSENEALLVSFIESRADPSRAAPFVDLAIEADVPVPLPSEASIDLPWSAPELLRVEAMLHLWHNTPDAELTAETKLLRALEIAREQTALSWELRVALSLARLRIAQQRRHEARATLAAVYDRFSEGFGTADLCTARALLDTMPQTGSGCCRSD